MCRVLCLLILLCGYKLITAKDESVSDESSNSDEYFNMITKSRSYKNTQSNTLRTKNSGEENSWWFSNFFNAIFSSNEDELSEKREDDEKPIPKTNTRPHIIFILADDMGWNDVSFHGNGQFLTPNIDALAYNGIILNRLYATHICTPSRSALMSGFHPIHIGMQHKVIYAMEPRGLPLHLKILPQYLNDLGYESHIVGKWHLGFWQLNYTPLYRGFKSHWGPWSGHHHYYDHWAREWGTGGLDMRKDLEPDWNSTGIYTTDLIAQRSVEIIQDHNLEKPLFLYIPHVACHSADPNDTLPAPKEIIDRYKNITNINRQKFAAITWKMDESIGAVVEALGNKGMLNNSIIVFSSDNGGAAGGFNLNAASNYPLKGVKNTLWEGGTRVPAFIWSPLLEKRNRVSNQYMYFTDWLPTLYHAAGGNVENLEGIDGMNLWPALSNDLPSPRTEILYNIDDIFQHSAIVQGEWKVIRGTMYSGQWDKWIGVEGRSHYDFNEIENSPAYKALKSIGYSVSINQMKKLQNSSKIIPLKTTKLSPCNLRQEICLFNIKEDPTETNNLASNHPNIVRKLLDRLEELNKTVVQPNNKPLYNKAHPRYFQWTWSSYGDQQNTFSKAEEKNKRLFRVMSELLGKLVGKSNYKNSQSKPQKTHRDEANYNKIEFQNNGTFSDSTIAYIENVFRKILFEPPINCAKIKNYPEFEYDLSGKRYLDVPFYSDDISCTGIELIEKKMYDHLGIILRRNNKELGDFIDDSNEYEDTKYYDY